MFCSGSVLAQLMNLNINNLYKTYIMKITIIFDATLSRGYLPDPWSHVWKEGFCLVLRIMTSRNFFGRSNLGCKKIYISSEMKPVTLWNFTGHEFTPVRWVPPISRSFNYQEPRFAEIRLVLEHVTIIINCQSVGSSRTMFSDVRQFSDIRLAHLAWKQAYILLKVVPPQNLLSLRCT